MEPTLVARLKSITQAVVATTALVTAITSLVKACDKRLEQASYETLSASIQDIQKDQAAIRADLLALRDRDGDGLSDEDFMKMMAPIVPDAAVPAPPTSASFGPYVGTFQPPHLPKHDAGVPPLASASPATAGSVAPRPPPPSWDHVQIMAAKM